MASKPSAKFDPSTLSRMLVEGSEHEDLLVRALQECQTAMDAGEPIDHDAILAKYPAIVSELSACLEGLALMKPEPSGSESGVDAVTGQLSPSAALGDFRIQREIGRGGMGVVYEAEQLSVGRKVALKVLPYAAMLDKRQVARFQNEARAAATLEHPHIVPVYYVGNQRGVYYYAMRLIDGKNLAEVLTELRGSKPEEALSQVASRLTGGAKSAVEAKPDRDWPKDDTVRDAAADTKSGIVSEHSSQGKVYFQSIARLGRQAAEALEFAHSHGITHRDIKPANIMLDEVGDAWITDFGLARIESDAGMTMTGDLVGTLRYMSPEQLLAKRVPIDHRSDIYSLGATLYEMLTLQPLFEGQDRASLLRSISFNDPVQLSKVRRGIPRDLETIIHQALQKNPTDRYQSAKDLADDLRRFAGNHPIGARSPGVRDKFRKWLQRNPRTASLVATTVCIIAIVSTTAWAFAASAYQGEYAQSQLASKAAEQALVEKSIAQQALSAEEAARRVAQTNLEQARKNLYQSHLREAQAALQRGHVGRAERLLHSYMAEPNTTDHRNWEWYYLLGKLEGGSRVLTKANSNVVSVCMSPSGKHFAAVTAAGGAYLWNADSLSLIDKLDVPYGRFTGAEFSPDGKTLAVLSGDSALRLWSVDDGQLATLKPAEPKVGKFAPSWNTDGRRVAVATHEGVVVWDVQTGEDRLLIPEQGVLTAAWNPAGDKIAHNAWGSLHIVDVKNIDDANITKPHGHDLWSIHWKTDATELATGAFDQHAKILDSQSGEVLHDFFHKSGVSAIAFSPDEKRLASATAGQKIVVWDVDSEQMDFELTGSRAWVRALAWTADGNKIVAGGLDENVRIWKTPQASRLAQVSSNVRVHPKDARFVHSATENHYSVQGLFSDSRDYEVDGDQANWNASGDRLVVRDGTTIRIIDDESGDELSRFSVPAGHRLLASLSGDGRYVATLRKAILGIWDVSFGHKVGEIDLSTSAKSGASNPWTTVCNWSPTGSLLAIVTDRNVQVWDASSVTKVASIDDHQLTSSERHVNWSPDGTRISTAGWEGVINIWEARSGTKLHRLVGHSAHRFIRSVAWSPDGMRLASGGHDQNVKIWDTVAGREIHSLGAHSSRIRSVKFSPSGVRLASSDDGGTIRLWDPISGEELMTLAEGLGSKSLHWTEDGRTLLASTPSSANPSVENENGQTAHHLAVIDASRGFEIEKSGELVENVARRYLELGVSYASSKRFEESISAFATAERMVGPKSWARYRRGRSFAVRHMFDEAMVDLELACSVADAQPEARNELAWLLVNRSGRENQDPERAERIARALIAEWPKQGEFWTTLGLSLVRQEKWKEAKAALDQALENSLLGRSQIHWLQSICLAELGQLVNAKESLEHGDDAWDFEEGYSNSLTYNNRWIHDTATALIGAKRNVASE